QQDVRFLVVGNQDSGGEQFGRADHGAVHSIEFGAVASHITCPNMPAANWAGEQGLRTSILTTGINMMPVLRAYRSNGLPTQWRPGSASKLFQGVHEVGIFFM